MDLNEQNDFLSIINENQKIISRYCLMYTNELMTFEDLYQETIYNLWKSYQSFKGNCKSSTWVYRVTINTCITYIRLKYKRGHHLELIKAINVPEEIAADNHKSELYSMISRLSMIDRSIIMLWLDEKSYSEIAETLGISETNVGSRLNRAKGKLKQMFNQSKS